MMLEREIYHLSSSELLSVGFLAGLAQKEAKGLERIEFDLHFNAGRDGSGWVWHPDVYSFFDLSPIASNPITLVRIHRPSYIYLPCLSPQSSSQPPYSPQSWY
jgi:hypothetical protein